MSGRGRLARGVKSKAAGEPPATRQTHSSLIKTRVPIDFSRNFHNRKMGDHPASNPSYKPDRPRNRNAPDPASMARCARCTNSGHPLVDRLHSIACKRDKSGYFLLTIKMKGVKTTSFFDTF